MKPMEDMKPKLRGTPFEREARREETSIAKAAREHIGGTPLLKRR